ncbi:MAG: pellicle/biofilm biosynthesis protein PelD [Nitrospirales bacterium]|nr:MAG: pellicle/biofilm biosynthesis protein PelD [Nitrospirales bacterium]
MRLPVHLRAVPKPWQWVETCLLTCAILGFSHWMIPGDPFLTTMAFPWLWIGSLLLGLRYGTWAGLLSVGIVLSSLFLEIRFGFLNDETVPKAYVIGGVLFIAICGEFGSRWNMYLQQMEERNDYLDQRLQETARAYHLLGMSHHSLEEHLISQPLTLRDALKRLRGMLIDEDDEIPTAAVERFLELLTQFFQLEVAAFYRALPPHLPESPLASVGTMECLKNDDPLVHHARTTKEFSHVMMSRSVSVANTQYLIVAPAMASNGVIAGWFVVERMHFLNLHEDSLHMLKIFLHYFADGCQAAVLARPILEQYPECPVAFARELPRLVRLQYELGLDSRVVIFDVGTPSMREEIVFHILHHTRGLDVTWDIRQDELRRLCILLPFTDDAAIEGYLGRIQQLLRERFGKGFQETEIQVSIRGLHEHDPSTIVQDLVVGNYDRKNIPVLSGVA